MGRLSTGGRRSGRVLLLVVLTLALLTLFAVAAQSALAYSGWIHDTTTGGPTSCGQCHPTGTGDPGTNAACQVCHTTQTLRTGYNCWSCHRPGQSIAAVACNSCHLFSGGSATAYNTAFSHDAHVGSNLKSCTVCHTNIAANNPMHSNADIPAPTCTTCHKATPVDGAPVPHGPYVAAVACSTCHKGVDPNHPLSADVKTPTLAFTATQPTGNPDVTLKGTLKNGTSPLAGVTVYLQSTPDGTTFSDVTSVPTNATGAFTYTVVGAAAGLQYRAVAQGVAGPPVVLPAKKLVPVTVPVVKATITLKLSGLTLGTIKLLRTVTAKGVVKPLSVGEKVTLLIQKKNSLGKWVKFTTKSGLVKALGNYSIAWRTSKRGVFRMQTSIAASATHTKATSLPSKSFRVK
jgi:Cytochrome c7 and related cytochrome c